MKYVIELEKGIFAIEFKDGPVKEFNDKKSAKDWMNGILSCYNFPKAKVKELK